MLSRVYDAKPTGSSRSALLTPDVRTRIVTLHVGGKKPSQIASQLGLGRKQVSRVLCGD